MPASGHDHGSACETGSHGKETERGSENKLKVALAGSPEAAAAKSCCKGALADYKDAAASGVATKCKLCRIYSIFGWLNLAAERWLRVVI